MNKTSLTLLSFLSLFMLNHTHAQANQDLISNSPPNAAVYFIEPLNGQTVSGDIKVKFGLSGMGIAPAGIDVENTGHHHLLIDVNETELPDLSQPLPSSENVIHFGKGQSETTITLPAGEHTLQLILGNYLHIPHDPAVISEKITITVE